MSDTIVIIGGGTSGLVCGAILSKFGYKVTVLDMNKQIGGTLQIYSRDKCIFDSGVHYIGGLSSGQNLHTIFKYLGIINQLKMVPLAKEAFDKIVFYSDNSTYCFAQGHENFKKTLKKYFPDESNAIDRYCEEVINTCNEFPLYHLKTGSYIDYIDKLSLSASDFIDSLTSNVRLRMVLAGNNPLYAGIRNETPWYVHALILNSYIESSWRMVGGGAQIAKQLINVIRQNGGTVLNRSKVVNLHEENGRIEYAEIQDGTQFPADHFISSIHPAQMLQMTSSKQLKPAYRTRIGSLPNSISFFVLNITLKPNLFENERSNYYCYMKDEVWSLQDYHKQDWPPFYALFYGSKDPQSEYADAITVMTYMRFDEVSEWAGTVNTTAEESDRGASYDKFKIEKTERLLDILEVRFPTIRSAVLNTYASTPLTFRDYMGTSDGSIYGIRKDSNSPGKSIMSPRTKIGNLLMTGQNLNLHGILGVTISSLVTCSQLIGTEKLLQEIQKHD